MHCFKTSSRLYDARFYFYRTYSAFIAQKKNRDAGYTCQGFSSALIHVFVAACVDSMKVREELAAHVSEGWALTIQRRALPVSRRGLAPGKPTREGAHPGCTPVPSIVDRGPLLLQVH